MVRSLLVLLALCCALAVVGVRAHGSDVNGLESIQHANIQVAIADDATISIDTSVLHSTGERAGVSWSGIPTDTTGHWIGFYSPRPADFTTTTPMHFRKLAGAASGKIDVFFVNARSNYVAAYFVGGLATPKLIAVSEPVPFEHENVPMHIHLAFTKELTQMRVDWTSSNNATFNPRVMWGETAANLSFSAAAESATYAASDMCGGPATKVGFHEPGWQHTAVMGPLKPNTEYFYRVEDDTDFSDSEVWSFRSAPVVGATTDVDFFVFGDLGQSETDSSDEQSQMGGSLATTRRLQTDVQQKLVNPDLSPAVFHIGDISYARGYAPIWEQFFWEIQNTSKTMPWMVGIGNHERDYPNSGSLFTGTDSGGECGVPFERRFHMPTSDVKDTPWYSVQYGPVHIVVMSTEHPYGTASAQGKWLEADLSKVDRKVTPFIIFTGHRPMYSVDGAATNTSAELLSTDDLEGAKGSLRSVIEPLLGKYKVDVAMWGHIHSYQRTCAVRNSVCKDQAEGTIHIVTGCSGAGPKNAGTNRPAWLLHVEDTVHGYTRAHVRNHVLTLDFVNSATGVIMDTIAVPSKFTGAAIVDERIALA